MLKGIMTIKGTWTDGSPLLAVPNFTRLNLVGTTALPQQGGNGTPGSIIWIKKE